LVSVIFHLILALVQCPDGSPPPCQASRPVRGGAPQPGSIAVLPFTNRSPDTSDAWLADALAEQIIGRLATVPQLRVKSATAVSAQWRRTPDAMASARALGVEWFVTGSIRRSGRQLAVSAELVRVSTGDGAWSAPFRRGDDDIAAVEEQIAESVAVAIVGRLAPGQSQGLRRAPARDPEAYRLYLYGRTLASRRTIEDVQAAVRAFSEAARLDPQFAGAWARLGHARSLQVQYGNLEGLPAESTLKLGETHIARALALDSGLAEAWQAAGITATLQRDLALARQQLERARQLDSLQFEVFHSLGYLYSVDFLDDPDRAEPLFRRALALNPDFRNSWRHYALINRNRGDLARAEALLDTALSFGPWPIAYGERAYVRYARGNRAGALADLERAGRTPASIPVVLTDSGRAAVVFRFAPGDTAARTAFAVLEAGTGSDFESLALLLFVRGDRAGALDALERMRATPDSAEPRCGREFCSVSLRTWRALRGPVLRGLRGDPRYERLLAETRPRIPWL